MSVEILSKEDIARLDAIREDKGLAYEVATILMAMESLSKMTIVLRMLEEGCYADFLGHVAGVVIQLSLAIGVNEQDVNETTARIRKVYGDLMERAQEVPEGTVFN